MATARDVAQYILNRLGPMPAMKLQKLLYYCQAWSLVWDGDALFDEDFEAWANGPVVRDVWLANRYVFEVQSVQGARPGQIGRGSAKTIDAVLRHYGGKNATELSNLTHMEGPWLRARARDGVRAGESSSEVISKHEMRTYYSSRAERRGSAN